MAICSLFETATLRRCVRPVQSVRTIWTRITYVEERARVPCPILELTFKFVKTISVFVATSEVLYSLGDRRDRAIVSVARAPARKYERTITADSWKRKTDGEMFMRDFAPPSPFNVNRTAKRGRGGVFVKTMDALRAANINITTVVNGQCIRAATRLSPATVVGSVTN